MQSYTYQFVQEYFVVSSDFSLASFYLPAGNIDFENVVVNTSSPLRIIGHDSGTLIVGYNSIYTDSVAPKLGLHNLTLDTSIEFVSTVSTDKILVEVENCTIRKSELSSSLTYLISVKTALSSSVLTQATISNVFFDVDYAAREYELVLSRTERTEVHISKVIVGSKYYATSLIFTTGELHLFLISAVMDVKLKTMVGGSTTCDFVIADSSLFNSFETERAYFFISPQLYNMRFSRSFIFGFFISSAHTIFEGPVTLTNTVATWTQLTTFVALSGTTIFIQDESLAPPPLGGATVIFIDATLDVRPGARIAFSSPGLNSKYGFYGNVTIGSASAPDLEETPRCGFEISNFAFLGTSNHIVTYCDTAIFEGIESPLDDSWSTFEAGADSNASLELGTGASFDISAFMFEDFELLVLTPPLEPSGPILTFQPQGRTRNMMVRWPISYNALPNPARQYVAYEYEKTLPAALPTSSLETSIQDPVNPLTWMINYESLNDTMARATFVFSPEPQTSAPSQNVPSACVPAPPTGFICGPGGSWITNGSTSTPGTFIIPSTTVVNVNGNFTIGGNIVFDGAGSGVLNINGCLLISPGSQVEFDFTNGIIKPGSRTLINQAGNCPTALNSLGLLIKQPKKRCKKAKSKIDSSSTRTTLNVLITVDSSACNTKWIILGAVLGSVVILAVIGIIITVTVYNSRKHAAERARVSTERNEK